jgi:hypothetical protein
LSERAAHALRAASARTGRSQQDLLREAVDRYLGLSVDPSSRDRAVAEGRVKPPSTFRDAPPSIALKRGTTTLDLLDRDER